VGRHPIPWANGCAFSTKRTTVSGLTVKPGISVVIPTYRRDQVLVQTLEGLLALAAPPAEIIVVDQSESHDKATERWLNEHSERGSLRWIRLEAPSIPVAMNRGLLEAREPVVLFLDDDIRADPALAEAHARAHESGRYAIVAGRVLQPWHDNGGAPLGGFAALEPGERKEFMGGNFSVRRDAALRLGGFDENFVRVAYRFEAEFADRVRAAGGAIWFEPGAMIHHLKVPTGGTRTFGDHLRTASPSHTVGEYYYLLRARPAGWLRRMAWRPWRSVATRHHLSRPWWIVPTLIGEALGALWALALWLLGPKLLRSEPK
jgi:GT2 family glycosyltransferase